ncbi:MAG: HAD hydrolase-like protein [Rhodobacteraceae bacterium]|nr:HAD hydrolase-like protein [Paracoccaceae bacterium]
MSTTVFLDLDGTLTDSKPGIIGSVRHAMEMVGEPVPHPDAIDWVIGPPLLDSFRKLGVPDPDLALSHYRDRYTTTGLLENRVYDGVPEVLVALREAGHGLCVATAKPHAYARRITAHFDLARHFDHEFGPELDGTRGHKADLLAHALEVTGVDPARSVMIGDRHHDIDAARAVGMAAIGVRWGYGDAAELAHADAHCDTPAEIPSAVARLLGRD